MKTRSRSLQGLVIVLGAVLVYAALSFGIYNGLTQRALGANDFFSRWMGARALVLRGQNPYDDAVTREIQMGMYGRLARTDEDQVAFAYPLYAAYIAAPLVALPYAWAQALWMALLVLGVIAGAFALAFVNRIALSPLAVAVIVLGALFFYPSVRGTFLGQYALLSFALIALAGLAIATGHDTTAGILLGVSAVKPQPVIFLLPVVFYWALRNGRRRVAWSGLACLGILIGSSFVWLPTWLTDFVRGLGNYAHYAPVGPPLETFFKLLLPAPASSVAFLISAAILIAIMVVMVGRGARSTWHVFQPTLGFAALVTTLIAGRIGTPDQVLLLILWMAWIGSWLAQGKRAAVIVGMGFLIAAPWLVFLTTLQGNQEAVVVTTILPMATLAVFGFTQVKRREAIQAQIPFFKKETMRQ